MLDPCNLQGGNPAGGVFVTFTHININLLSSAGSDAAFGWFVDVPRKPEDAAELEVAPQMPTTAGELLEMVKEGETVRISAQWSLKRRLRLITLFQNTARLICSTMTPLLHGVFFNTH